MSGVDAETAIPIWFRALYWVMHKVAAHYYVSYTPSDAHVNVTGRVTWRRDDADPVVDSVIIVHKDSQTGFYYWEEAVLVIWIVCKGVRLTFLFPEIPLCF